MRKNKVKKEYSEFEQKLLDIARVARVMEGGKRFNFRATVVIGNRKGKVGVGIAKALNVANAVEKAVSSAKKNAIEFPLAGRTIPHEISSKVESARILLMPAVEGRGIIAGGAVRAVLELAGIKDVSSKILGSSNKVNNARAAVEALRRLKDSIKKEVAAEEKIEEEQGKENAKKDTRQENNNAKEVE